MSQPVRFATLEKFRAGEIRLLVCSDVAARGLDIGGLSHVFNFDVPHHSEDYVHRIGRTGRAGREGHAYTFATPGDREAVQAIERLIGHQIPHLAVEGLDPVDWAADDGDRRGRRRRTAGRAGAAQRPRPVHAVSPDQPRADREPKRNQRAAPPSAPRPSVPRPSVPRAAAPRPSVPREAAPQEATSRQQQVRGFGSEVPAFMQLTRRDLVVPEKEPEESERSP
ncbi:MAG: helicase-related protein [Acetobacteraceae bacterium]